MSIIQKNLSTYHLLLFAWLFLSLLGGIETVMIFLFRPETIISSKFYWFPFLRVVNGFAAITFVLYPGYNLLRLKNVTHQVIGYIFLLILFVFVYLIFAVGLFQFLFLEISFDLFIAGIFETMMTDLHHIAAYYFFLLFICASKDYYDDKTQAIVKREQLEKELTQTKFLVLQRQLQPHFLFNTLNSAISIMEERKKPAQEMLVDLSELLRNSLEINFEEKIPLKKEIELLRSYLSIEKKRFEHQLEFEIVISEELNTEKVLPFLLQPLAENAIKHGYKGGVKQLSIKIEVIKEFDRLKIWVSNNGDLLRNETMGIGIKNIQERLKTTYGDDFNFELKQKNNRVINLVDFPSK